MTTTEATELLPENEYFLLDTGVGLRLDEIARHPESDQWTIQASFYSDSLSIRTPNPAQWLTELVGDPGHQHDRFAGLRIGDVVRRGKGKLLWRITGLQASPHHGAVISLLSMPAGTGTSGMALSPQSFGVVGTEAIATLTKVEQ